jgi:hypothetical protein
MSTDAYLDAKHEFQQIDSEVKAIGKAIAEVGNALVKQPERFIFSNTGIGLPGEVALNPQTPSADGRMWLSANDIQQKLSQLHQARQKMMATWNAVPQERRSGIVSPGGGLQGRDYR